MSNQTETAEAGLPATLETAAQTALPSLPAEGLTLLDAPSFERALKLAEMMSEARGLPGFFNRSPGSCLAAIETGLRLRVSPFVVACNSYQAHPSAPMAYLGKFVIAVINNHPAVSGKLDFKHEGPWENVQGKFEVVDSRKKQDDEGNAKKYAKSTWANQDEVGCKVICRGTIAATGEVKEFELEMRQCWPRNSTLWATNPKKQICYVAARSWADLHAPEILMGMLVAGEVPDGMIDVSPDAPAREAQAQRPGGSRLSQFVQQHSGPTIEGSAQPAQDATGARPAQGQGDLGLAGDRAPAGAGASATGQQHTAQQAGQGEPQRPTMVDVFLPGATAGETLAISAASALILREAAGKDRAWLDEAQKINPWIARHKVTREAIMGLVHDLEEGKQP